jgi:hypothetical protein
MKAAKEGYIVEDSVDILVKKLESQGKKVKIIEEGEEEDEVSPDGVKQKKKKAKKQQQEEEDEDLIEED